MKVFSTRRAIFAVVMATAATLVFLTTGIGGTSALAAESSSVSSQYRSDALVVSVLPAGVVNVDGVIEVSAIAGVPTDRDGTTTAPGPRASPVGDGTPTAIAAIVLLLFGVVLVLIWWKRRSSDSIS